MRKTRARSVPVLLMTVAFFAGLLYFFINLVYHSAQWAAMPWNGHLADQSGLEQAGMILDRNGVVLAKSENGRRIYHEDEAVRRACLHVVGDDSINIATAVQTVYRTELSGYQFVTGLGAPEALTKKSDLTLTIDSNVQKTALEALGDRKGAVFVYDYRTGEIICMVSTPAYDPENVPEDIEDDPQYEGAYLNRALSASYPPGSTFKLVTGAAALKNIADVENREYYCSGSEVIGGEEVACYDASGEVDFRDAMMYSCNSYFALLAVETGREKMTEQAEKCGFNASIVFDGIEALRSSYDVASASENELAWSGVGQYTVLETPVNMTIRTAAIANGGIGVTPKILGSSSRNQVKASVSSTPSRKMMDEATAAKLAEIMDYTVLNYYGKSTFSDQLDVCAKTGTAEVGGGDAPHAWVTGFTKDPDCTLAFSVIVENGNSGYGAAVPVAAQVLEEAAVSLRRNDNE